MSILKLTERRAPLIAYAYPLSSNSLLRPAQTARPSPQRWPNWRAPFM